MRIFSATARGIAGFVVLAAAWAAVAAPIRIDVSARPEGAKVLIDGVSKGVVPVSVLDVGEGRHLLRVEAPGRRPVEEVLSVKPEDFIRKDYELEPEKGLLLIKTDPPGADVRQGGVSLGATPLLVTTLDTDQSYAFDLECIGYQKKRIDVTLSGRAPVARTEKLVLDSGIVDCQTEPAGATVLVNGIARGTTPCVVERVPKGYATFVFKLKGYEEEKRELRIAPGDKQLLSLSLMGRPAKVSVISSPEGARVTVDDNYAGKTPLTLSPVRPGVHTIKAELAGYAPVFKTVVVENGGEATEMFKFESVLGWIEVATTPPGAKILLDGKAVGTTMAHRGKKADLSGVKSDVLYLRDIEAGEHEIVAHLRGYADFKRKVKIEAKKGVQFMPRLKRVFIADTEIETVNGTYRGVLMDSDNPDTYRLEVKEGITQDFRKADVRSIKSLLD